MVVKTQIHSKIDLEDERVKNFLRGGAPVLEDVYEEERKKEEKRKQEEEIRLKVEEENKKKAEEEKEKWTMFSMRIPMKLLKAVDEKAKKRYMNRSAWLMEMIQEKLTEEFINSAPSHLDEKSNQWITREQAGYDEKGRKMVVK